MGYYTTYTLAALDPTTLEQVDMEAWPESFKAGVGSYIYSGYSDSVDWATGRLFSGEPQKWYSYQVDLQALSANLPQVVWVLRGSGENSGDEWVLYAYRGSSYKVEAGKWVPPPPDMSKLPEAVQAAVFPPTAEDALLAVLEEDRHPSTCPVDPCRCYLAKVRAALEALGRPGV